ncbi:Pyridoxal biosynthesis lyase pdxS [Rothia dentocariosa]|uniref:pyridoxal 5'-phosphate synthase (glutamine hydrolyzing) n=1 Tax=Rothia dentocariosa TaxID=2047 RepID=A0A3S5F7Q1_9MICC|nr:Pyridoxal biosynthesis lyase pdxS [Rothia dentocariosa]
MNHIDKHQFTVPFVCGATNLGEALRRIAEGAAMIRSKGEAGTGDVSEATKHIRTIKRQIAELQGLYNTMPDELYVKAKELAAPTTWCSKLRRPVSCPWSCLPPVAWQPPPTPP